MGLKLELLFGLEQLKNHLIFGLNVTNNGFKIDWAR